MTCPSVQHKKRKRELSPSPDTLRLVLETSSVPVRKRRRCQHPRLQLDYSNRLLGSVNGHACPVQLDSGAQFSFIFWSTARRLGLITGTEATTKVNVNLWIGVRTLNVVHLHSVTIDLGSGVQVVTPVTVFPACLESLYDADDVTLDAYTLQRGGMVQVFRPGGSELLVCRPQRLLQRARKKPGSVQLDELRVRRGKRVAGDSCMRLLLDTGATGIHVSARRKRLLLESLEDQSLPRRFALELGGGICLKAEPLEVVKCGPHDFIMGTTVLCQYGAVYSHANHTLDFPGPTGWRRVFTQQPR